ncbi:hypothetical protein N2152v2_008078 [Parachlorella kessleri]
MQVNKRKRRLDDICVEMYPEYSKNVVQSWILQGKVLVNDQPVLKCGTQVASTASVQILAENPKYVCRAGLKLEKALDHFGISCEGKTALDSGLSTGGFADCLLQRGATHVWGVDVGYGQVAEKVRQDPRVTVLERTNLRNLRLPDIGGSHVDLVTLDLSFISVLKVMEVVCDILKPHGELVVLIKPQFEAGKQQVSAGGVVRDPLVHQQVIHKVVDACQQLGFSCQGWTESPIKGASAGNTEFLAYFQRTGTAGSAAVDAEAIDEGTDTSRGSEDNSSNWSATG